MIQSSRGYTVVTDTVSYKSGGERGPEMIVRIQGEVTLRSCPYSQSKGSNSEGNYQLVEFVACSPSQVQNPTFLSTIHHRSSLPFPSGHPGSSSRWKIGPWPGVYAEESSAVFSTNYFLVRGKHGGVSYNNSVIYGPRRRRGMHVGSVANHMIGQWSTVSGGRPVVGFVSC